MKGSSNFILSRLYQMCSYKIDALKEPAGWHPTRRRFRRRLNSTDAKSHTKSITARTSVLKVRDT